MKKLVSFIILIAMILMLEFNFLKNVIPNAYVWIEPILVFGAFMGILVWNGILKKK